MTQTMYAENQHRVPRYSFPYQKQQRTSGAFVVSRGDHDKPILDQDDLEKLRAALVEKEKTAGPTD